MHTQPHTTIDIHRLLSLFVVKTILIKDSGGDVDDESDNNNTFLKICNAFVKFTHICTNVRTSTNKYKQTYIFLIFVLNSATFTNSQQTKIKH